MLPARVPDHPCHHLHARPPIGWWIRRESPAPEDGIHHLEQETVFVLDVPVERHRGDTDLVRNAAHRDGTQTFGIGDRDGGSDDAIRRQATLERAVPPGRWCGPWPSPIPLDH